jgi:ribosome-associated protein
MPDESTVPDLKNLERRERERVPVSPEDLQAIHARALRAAQAAVGVKAEDARLLDMHDLVAYTDYLVVCTGRNSRLTRRISEEVGFRIKEEFGLLPKGMEGASSGEWILMDYLDFVVHIFTPEARDFYRLDVLWKQAPAEEVE